MVVVEVGEKRTAQCPPGDRPGVQSRPDSREAHPHPRDHGRNRKPLRSWYTQFVPLNRYSLDWV